MQLEYVVGSRVDGLYDGNNDDMWYPGRIQRINSASVANDDDDAAATYEVLYDDGEIEYQVAPKNLRVHVSGTLCVGTRVFGRYAGGDEWYPGKVTEVQENGCYTIEYDDTEVEADVSIEFIKEPIEAVFEPATEPEEATAQVDKEEEEGNGEERDHEVVADHVEDEAAQVETGAAMPVPDEPEPVYAIEPASINDEEAEESPVDSPSHRDEEEAPPEPQQPTIVMQQPHHYELERPRFHPKPKPVDNESPPQYEPQQWRQPEATTNHFETDEYASIVESIELLGKRLADAALIKAVLSTLVKQMRAFPQVTADLVHERNGERLVIDVLKFHDSYAVIQCYCFVLLRRLCFLCTKSTHYFLRNGIINFVTSAMRKFAEDAILQASACGALAVFTRAHAGLNMLLEHQVAQLVLATIVYHKTYSIHTRQVHYYACEVLLELCELGDRTALDALCGDQVDAGLSDVSPISLLIFLLRQGLSFDDKKACCAVGTLLMCLAANNRYAAGLILRLNGLPELSTVMAKYPSEPGIQKYSASASKEIALSSIQKSPTTKKVKDMASEILQESGSLEDLHQERYHQVNGGARYAGGEIKNSSSRAGASGRSRTPGVGKRKTAPVTNYPSPTRGNPATSYKDPLSFSKFASPIGKAPYLPSNMTSFAAYPSSSSMAAQQQRNSLVILDGANGSEQMFLSSSSHPSERKQYVKEERQLLLFETYGVQGGVARGTPGSRTTQGIKCKQLKTHIVSAAESTWATPVMSPKKLMCDEMLAGPSTASSSYGQPFSSRSNIVGMGSYAPGTQRNYDMDEPTEEATDYHNHQQTYRSELSPTAAGRAQQPTKKKKKSTSTARESFQVKIESEIQLRISKEIRSPFASPISPSQKRTKGSSTASKTGAKLTAVRSSSHGVQRSSAVKRHPPKPAVNAESLTAYAAKLFNEDFGFEGEVNGADLRSGTSSNALSAREQAEIQERERLSFAEKLHKMIDKAKSTLAVSSVTSEPTSRSSRSTTSSKAVNGTKLLSSRAPIETSNIERPTAPAVKKIRVTSGSTPRKAATGESGSTTPTEQPPSLLSVSSQPKMQSHDVKKQSGSKLSSLSAPKRPIASLPTASAKSTASTTRASKPDSGRLTATPKSAFKSRPVAPSTKSAKPTTPAAAQRGSKETKGGHESSDKIANVEVDAKSVAAEEASHVDTAAAAIEPAIEQTAFSVSSDISSQATVDEDAERARDLEIASAPQEPEEPAESVFVDEAKTLIENDQPAGSEETNAAPPESEPEQVDKPVNANDTDVGSSVDEKHDDEVAATEETTSVPKSTESSATQSEVVDSAPSESELPPDVATADNPGTETQSTVAPEEDLDAPAVVDHTSDDAAAPALQSDAAPPPQIDAAPVDDIYADEYNEFDDDGAGDEAAEPSDMLDEQLADSGDRLGGGNVPLDELLSLADQLTKAVPELPPSGDASATAIDDNTAPDPADDIPPEAAESVLSSSKSGDDLYADETAAEFDEAHSGPSSAHPTQDTESLAQDLSVGDLNDSDTNPVSGEAEPDEPQTEVASQLVDTGALETSSAPEEVPPTADTSATVDKQPPIDADVQDSVETPTVVDNDASPPNGEDGTDKDSAESNSTASPSGDETETEQEDKESENAACDHTAAQPLEDQSSASPLEAIAVDEATLSPRDENDANEVAPADDNEIASPPADESVESESAEDRPVSQGADSYAEDGFDFEPEEETGKQPAVIAAFVDLADGESSGDQKGSKRADADDQSLPSAADQSPPSAADVVEPVEILEPPLDTADNSEEALEQAGDQGDSAERTNETNEPADVESVQTESAETGEQGMRSEDSVAPSKPVSSGSAVDTPEVSQEEPTPAATSVIVNAEDVAPNEDVVETDAELVAETAIPNADVEAEEEAGAADEYGEEFADADFEETEATKSESAEQSSPRVVEVAEPIETDEQPQDAAQNIEDASEQDEGDLEVRVEEANPVADVEIAPADSGKPNEPETLFDDFPASSDKLVDQPVSSESAVKVSEGDRIEEPTEAAMSASVDSKEAAPISGTATGDAGDDTHTDDQAKDEADVADEYGDDYDEADFEETETVGDEQTPPPNVEDSELVDAIEQPQEATGNCETALEQSGKQGDSENQAQEESSQLADVETAPTISENPEEPVTSSEEFPASSDEQIEEAVSSENGMEASEPRNEEELTSAASVNAEDAAPIDDSVDKEATSDAEVEPEAVVTNSNGESKEEAEGADEYDGDYGEADFEETESSGA